MNLVIHIPTWLLWSLGIIAGVAALFLSFLGVMFIVQMVSFQRSMGRWFGW